MARRTIRMCCGHIDDDYALVEEANALRLVPHDRPICQRFRVDQPERYRNHDGDQHPYACSRTQCLFWIDAKRKFSTYNDAVCGVKPTVAGVWSHSGAEVDEWAEGQFMLEELLPIFDRREWKRV